MSNPEATDVLLAASHALLDLREMLDAGYFQRLRGQAGISRDSLGVDLGCGGDDVTAWEAGVTRPGVILGLQLQAAIREIERQLAAEGALSFENWTPVRAVVLPLGALRRQHCAESA